MSISRKIYAVRAMALAMVLLISHSAALAVRVNFGDLHFDRLIDLSLSCIRLGLPADSYEGLKLEPEDKTACAAVHELFQLSLTRNLAKSDFIAFKDKLPGRFGRLSRVWYSLGSQFYVWPDFKSDHESSEANDHSLFAIECAREAVSIEPELAPAWAILLSHSQSAGDEQEEKEIREMIPAKNMPQVESFIESHSTIIHMPLVPQNEAKD